MLSRDDIRRALLALARELDDTSARCEIVVLGGAALVLLYGAREATKDVDVLILSGADPALVRRAIEHVGRALISLPTGLTTRPRDMSMASRSATYSLMSRGSWHGRRLPTSSSP